MAMNLLSASPPLADGSSVPLGDLVTGSYPTNNITQLEVTTVEGDMTEFVVSKIDALNKALYIITGCVGEYRCGWV